jgi:arabinofuranosyltransferase
MKRSSYDRLILGMLFSVFVIVAIRNAWMCDDAYISFRTIENFLNGFGLTWNIAERVQAFTHPLWLLVVTGLYGISGELYFTVVITSIFLTVAAVWVLVRHLSAGVWEAALGITILVCSKAFIDYTTSGLENPLSFLLVAIFLAIYFTQQPSRSRLLRLSLIAALIALNRLDLMLIIAPPLAYAAFRTPKGKRLKILLTGFAPLLLWEMFSLIYYGFLLPNTYYAKLHTGIATSDLIHQGFVYYLETSNLDPLTLVAIALGVVAARAGRIRGSGAVVVGVLLYLIYTVRIGGDFMVGRFFTVPLLCAVAILIQYPLPHSALARAVPLVLVVLVGLISPRSPLLSDRSYGLRLNATWDRSGVADERAFYFQGTGLLQMSQDYELEHHDWADHGRGMQYRGTEVHVSGAVGYMGFNAGPYLHIIDKMALADPLLARLPTSNPRTFRIGHFDRIIPDGYESTWINDSNVIVDSGLAAYYDKLRIIAQGPVWTFERLKTIARMNLGMYDHLLEEYDPRPAKVVPMSDLSKRKSVGSLWNGAGNAKIEVTGVRVTIDSVVHVPEIELSLDNNDIYEITIERDREKLATIELPPGHVKGGGMRIDTLRIPDEVAESGYNQLLIEGRKGDKRYSVGHVLFLPLGDSL